MGKEEKKEDKEGHGLITALYKLNLHCPQCAREIKRPLLRSQGVQSVDVDIEKGEIKVIGKVDGKKIHERIEKISKKKVVMTLAPKTKDNKGEEKKGKKESVSISTTVLKVHMHCGKCEYDLKKTILKLKGVHSVKSDFKAGTLTVDGTLDPPKLVKYIHKKVRKHAEIVTKKTEKKVEEKKETVKEVEVKIVETKVEGEVKKVEAKTKDTAPYFVHYVYAPQLFSDENPNACSIM
ncbi:hypothetical protein IFM89_010389 [Coptis chinensis]|uniref:HMA domain-containing protein n=1 Tax=Coptis chinensis TaxID=261450 RepID=A0A835IW65_9MAGN|nr:hypothetical protein IFM89_010389 [Coptis chinensis]